MDGSHEHMTGQVLNHPEHDEAMRCLSHMTEEDLSNRELVLNTLAQNELDAYGEMLSALSDDEYEDFILNEIVV